jgi:hypothetical protein
MRAVGFMVVLAGLDCGGTILAKEWTVHRAHWQLVVGAACFVALFGVLIVGLRYAEMSILTIGWIVTLQAAIIAVDRARYGTALSTKGWLAMAAILALQAYLLIGAATEPAAGDSVQPSAASAAS